MSFTLRETEWAETAIADKKLGKSPYETLRRVARYYIDSGKSKSEVKESVEEFLIACDKTASIVKWGKTIDAALTFASKHPAVNIDCVPITKSELSKIDSLTSGRQSQRLAFTLLCLSKYWNKCTNTDSYWVNSSESEIMQMANIKTSIRRQCKLYHNLREDGLITFSRKVDCNHVRVEFADDESEEKMSITDFRNLGNQYLMYAGEPYFKCAECGIVTKLNNAGTGRKQKYCKDCAAVVKGRQSVISVERSRKNK